MGRRDHTLVAKNRTEPAQSPQLLDKPCLQKLKIVVMMQKFGQICSLSDTKALKVQLDS